MAQIQPSIEASNATLRDPWYWSVEDVVLALCNPYSRLRQTNHSTSFPDEAQLAAKLRELDVTGLALLQEIDSTCLREEFGIRSFGHIASIKHLISTLRRESVKYQEEGIRNSSSNFSRPHASVQPDMTPNYYGTLFKPSPRPGDLLPWQSPQIKDDGFENPYAQLHTLPAFDWSNVRNGTGFGNFASPQSMLPTAAPSPVDQTAVNDRELSLPRRDVIGATLVPSHTPEQNTAMPDMEQEQQCTPGQTAKVRKRIAPTFVAPVGPTDQQTARSDDLEVTMEEHLNIGALPVPETSVKEVDDRQSMSEPSREVSNELNIQPAFLEPGIAIVSVSDHMQPGVVHVDERGRKRVVPVSMPLPGSGPVESIQAHNELQSSPDRLSNRQPFQLGFKADLIEVNTRRFGKTPQRLPHQEYLGLRSFPVDEIFYPQTTLSQLLPEAEGGESFEFSIVAPQVGGSGRKLYVNKRIKHFLQCKPFSLNSKKQNCVGMIPYPERIVKKHVPLSMMVFTPDGQGGVTVTRENRSNWIDGHTGQISTAIDGGVDRFAITDAAFAKDEAEDDMWKALEKWNYVEDAEKILPAYGDSESEGEYDLDTWREMEEEAGKIERPLGKSTKPVLSRGTMEEVVDDTVKTITQAWYEKKRPKLEPKAYRIWMRVKRDRSQPHQIRAMQEDISILSVRVSKLRSEILEEPWTNEAKLRRQCGSLQPSVYDLEDVKWKQAVLKLQKAPDKLPSAHKPPKKKREMKDALEQPLAADEEDLISSDEETTGSEDSLDGFVISDEEDAMDFTQPAIFEDEMSMNEDTTNAKNSSFAEVAPLPGNGRTPTPSIKVQKSEKPALGTSASKRPDIVDLTQLSSDIEPEEISSVQIGPLPHVKTPPLDRGKNSDVWARPTGDTPRPKFKHRPLLSQSQQSKQSQQSQRSQSSIIDLDSTTEHASSPANTPSKRKLPPYWDVRAVCKMDGAALVEKRDHGRVLVRMIECSSISQRNLVWRLLRCRSMEEVQRYVELALRALTENISTLRGQTSVVSEGALQAASWFVAYVVPVVYDDSGHRPRNIEATLKTMHRFEDFYDIILKSREYYKCKDDFDSDEYSSEADSVSTRGPKLPMPQKKKKRKIRSDSEEDSRPSHRRKRVYVKYVSQDTLNLQETAQNRLRLNEERRRKELASDDDQLKSDHPDAEIIVNPGKSENQAYIYLDPRFGNGSRSLKPHQISGLQFLWREITAEPKVLQGCLLAHTMGLGKTSQVIALLVALSSASSHPDAAVARQVPAPLRKLQTLILCPPALVENWWDELILWVPKPPSTVVGFIRKLSASQSVTERVAHIQAWAREGGILIMGYKTFIDLLANKKDKSGLRPIEDDAHRDIFETLLNKTNLVIADEAHGFKNKRSQLHYWISRIKTGSRIAMTGSPLSNNLIEYFTIIDWISPKFLGTEAEFRAAYEEPINDGLYQESTEREYREALKRLKALQADIEPKVHRRDNAVLHDSLHGKMEFVIRLPLTELQRRLYQIFVEAVFRAIASGDPYAAVLWGWLRLLQLLCHHPKLFEDRLLEYEKEQAQGGPVSKTEAAANKTMEKADSMPSVRIETPSQVHLQAVIPSVSVNAKALLAPLADSLGSPAHSWKMNILFEIVKLSVAAKDKVLVVSQYIPALDYVSNQLSEMGLAYERIDGTLPAQLRQAVTKAFNGGDVDVNICLISAKAGGVGLNLFGANRVVILDEWFNPMTEHQAIGRSYRIGQQKPVYVYRLMVDGTFEGVLENMSLFKTQLANRVVDKRQPVRNTKKGVREYIFQPKMNAREDLERFRGDDPAVLDHLLHDQDCPILNIATTESFHVEDNFQLTPEEAKEAEQMRENQRLRRENPEKYLASLRKDNVFKKFAGPAPTAATYTMAAAPAANATPGSQPEPTATKQPAVPVHLPGSATK
ncbi:uncharacterized protein KY384_003859 [Bacidia gigantensis]|uniref:uncharacterized protein n=1 Tax=Bacidia gigantensis TaxID=2732470 RepID=UPI001D03FB08|nr:uncharacterized protein KY384_003859 [Bacidia gigantensis]KAG8532218.1 hypothetical protein KY384_003859 [Bacidia gigantensis]